MRIYINILCKPLFLIFLCCNALVPMEVDVEDGRDALHTANTSFQCDGVNFSGCRDRLAQMLSNVDCTGCRDRFVQGTKYVCELGAEVLVSVAVVGGSLALISVASSLQSKGEEQGAHYETHYRYVCTDDDTKGYHCKKQSYTECYGPYEACQDLDAANALFVIGGVGIFGTGAFWCYKIYNDYERFCVRH
jgi:hypothetical protein